MPQTKEVVCRNKAFYLTCCPWNSLPGKDTFDAEWESFFREIHCELKMYMSWVNKLRWFIDHINHTVCHIAFYNLKPNLFSTKFKTTSKYKAIHTIFSVILSQRRTTTKRLPYEFHNWELGFGTYSGFGSYKHTKEPSVIRRSEKSFSLLCKRLNAIFIILN